jgi:cell shape-determining protein MreC
MRPGPFGVALGVVLVVSLLPAAWIAPWTHRASELVGLPLVPLGDGWMAVRHWLVRPAERVVSSEDALRLDDENRLLRLELSQSREDVRELRRQLELYQGEEIAPGRRVRFIDARVVGSEPHASGELLHRINAGTARGVAPGTQVVTRRNVLLGEVVEVASGGTGRTVSYVRPLTSRQSGRFEGRILRDGETDVHAGDGLIPGGMVTPTGDGWTMDVKAAAAAEVRPGNEVVMVDTTRRESFGLVIGRVVSMSEDPSNAQWRQVRIEPLFRLEDEHTVELRVLVRESDDGGGGGR